MQIGAGQPGRGKGEDCKSKEKGKGKGKGGKGKDMKGRSRGNRSSSAPPDPAAGKERRYCGKTGHFIEDRRRLQWGYEKGDVDAKGKPIQAGARSVTTAVTNGVNPESGEGDRGNASKAPALAASPAQGSPVSATLPQDAWWCPGSLTPSGMGITPAPAIQPQQATMCSPGPAAAVVPSSSSQAWTPAILDVPWFIRMIRPASVVAMLGGAGVNFAPAGSGSRAVACPVSYAPDGRMSPPPALGQW